MAGEPQAEVQSANIIEPQPGPQSALVSCPIYEIFFGGARGGGKSYGVLLKWIDHASRYGESATGIVFRRTAKQLEEFAAESLRIFPGTGGAWNGSSRTWTWNRGPMFGARLKLAHLWDTKDASNYQGHSYTFVAMEELTNWPDPSPVNMIRATCRSAKGVKVCFIATGNPGGPGHNWVKARYITPAPLGYAPLNDPETGLPYIFIPSRLEDNPALMENDPDYESRLKGVGSPELVKAWRFGEWDIVAGGFFDDVWKASKHILKADFNGEGWTYRRSFDWGFAAPASLGMWAISPGAEWGGIWFPRGSVVRFDEWYTIGIDRHGAIIPNTGQKLTNDVLGRGIVERSRGLKWNGCVADPSIFTEAGGDSIYKQLIKGASPDPLRFLAGDNTRIAGWMQMRDMLEEAGKDRSEKPGMWVTENCIHFIRTIPVLQRDEKKLDDVDTNQEDHIADESRYLSMTMARGQRKVTKIAGV